MAETLSPQPPGNESLYTWLIKRLASLGTLPPDVVPLNLSPKDSVVRGSEVMGLHLSVGSLGIRIIWLPLWWGGAYNSKCIIITCRERVWSYQVVWVMNRHYRVRHFGCSVDPVNVCPWRERCSVSHASQPAGDSPTFPWSHRDPTPSIPYLTNMPVGMLRWWN